METNLLIFPTKLGTMPNRCTIISQKVRLLEAERELLRKFGNIQGCSIPNSGRSKVLQIGTSHTRHGGKRCGTYHTTY